MNKNLQTSYVFLSKKLVQFCLFVGILWLLFVHLEINKHLNDYITGLHYWRKSDTLSQIINYYHNGLNFFNHGIYYNQLQVEGRAVAEFPLYYYFVAIQLKLFGNYEFIVKLNWVLLHFVGLYCLFRIFQFYFKNFLLSVFCTLSIYLSPVFVIYSLEFLPDPIALNFVFIGMFFYLKFQISNKKNILFWSLFFISIAGMIKPFFLIPFISIILLALIDKYFFRTNNLKFNWYQLVPFLFIVLWFSYTHWYNSLYDTSYFLSKPRPIWNCSESDLKNISEAITTKWFADYMHPLLAWIILGSVIFNLAWWKKEGRLFTMFFLINLLGVVSFCLLFYGMFEHHDYYIYPILFLIPLTFGLSIFRLLILFKNSFLKFGFSMVLFLSLYFSMDYIWERIQIRRNDSLYTAKYYFENYRNMEHFLCRNGVSKQALVFAFSDKSPGFALSLLNRKGWSGFQTVSNKATLESFIARDVEFLIINKRAPSGSDSNVVSNYMEYFIADSNDIQIFDLRPYKKN